MTTNEVITLLLIKTPGTGATTDASLAVLTTFDANRLGTFTSLEVTATASAQTYFLVVSLSCGHRGNAIGFTLLDNGYVTVTGPISNRLSPGSSTPTVTTGGGQVTVTPTVVAPESHQGTAAAYLRLSIIPTKIPPR